MQRPITWFVSAVTLAATSLLAVSPMQGAQKVPAGAPQQFVVLQSQALTVPFETLTNDQAHCSISGSGSFATLRCQAPPGTAKASYHFVTMLVVDQQGMAYGIACHQSLVDLWCKKMPVGIAIQGNFDAARKALLVGDGQRSHPYQMLTSAPVGPVQPSQPSPKAARPAPAQTTPAEVQHSETGVAAADARQTASSAAASNKPEVAESAPANAGGSVSNRPGACVPTSASCTAFVSEPAGADIYVDGKFVGSTPSTLALAPGSHEIRIEANKFKPWTRTLESTAGSTVTVHAALSKK